VLRWKVVDGNEFLNRCCLRVALIAAMLVAMCQWMVWQVVVPRLLKTFYSVQLVIKSVCIRVDWLINAAWLG
jgi:hypothetical protein